VVDSNTYDITAWSLPYVYGLKSYATRQPVSLATEMQNTWKNNTVPSAEPYGYVIPWSGMASVKLVTQLMQKGIKLRVSELPFELEGNRFERGAVIVLKTSNQYYAGLWNEVRELANRFEVNLTAVSTGFVEKGNDFGSSHVRPLRSRRIALITGEGVSANAAGEIWHYFEKEIDYPVTLVNLNDLAQLNWNRYDVVIMPNGNYRFLNDKAAAETFRNWINSGGHVVALENAVAQLGRLDWAIKSKKAEEDESKETYAALKRYEDRERDYIPQMTPGSIYRVDLDNSHPLAFGYPPYYYTLKQDDAIYSFLKEGGWNVGVIKKEKQVAGFVGSRLKEKLQDGLLFGVQEIGRGTVTYLADDVLFRSFWENGKLMFANAVFQVGQ